MTLSAAQITTRDHCVRQLAAIAGEDPKAARTAGALLAHRIDALIAVKVAIGRRELVRDLALIPIARKWALRPKEMEGVSTTFVGPKQKPRPVNPSPDKNPTKKEPVPAYVYPAGFESFLAPEERPLTAWEAQAFQAVGYFDSDTAHELIRMRDEFRLGMTEKWVTKKDSDFETYLRIQVELHRGRMSAEQIRVQLDPDRVHDHTATSAWAIGHLLIQEREQPGDKIRTVDEWWLLALLLLFTLSPEFDGTAIGFPSPVLWRDKDAAWEHVFSHRAEIFWSCTMGGDFVTRDRTERILFLLQSTADHLLSIPLHAVASAPAIRAQQAIAPPLELSAPMSRSRPEREPAPQGWIYLTDAKVKYGLPKSTIGRYAGELKGGKEWLQDETSSQVRVGISALERVIAQANRLKRPD